MRLLVKTTPHHHGRLIAFDADTGATQYQVDGPYNNAGTQSYRILGLATADGPRNVPTLRDARRVIRNDHRRTARNRTVPIPLAPFPKPSS